MAADSQFLDEWNALAGGFNSIWCECPELYVQSADCPNAFDPPWNHSIHGKSSAKFEALATHGAALASKLPGYESVGETDVEKWVYFVADLCPTYVEYQSFQPSMVVLLKCAAKASELAAKKIADRLNVPSVPNDEETDNDHTGKWFDSDPPPDSKYKYGHTEGQLRQLEKWIDGGTQPTLATWNGKSFWYIRKLKGRSYAVWFDSQNRFSKANGRKLAEKSPNETKRNETKSN